MSKSNAWGGALAASENTKKLSVVDAATEKKVERQKAKKGSLHLDKIKDREQNTRNLNQKHVAGLADSIAELGLIQAIAVDQNGILLAGGHRLAAIRALRELRPDDYSRWFEDDLVPATTIHLGDSNDERERRALAIEVSENEKRRDYTAGEIQQLADRLREAGYREGSGRIAVGEKSLAPALALVMGKSLRTARRLLAATSAPSNKAMNKEILVLQRCQRAINAYFLTVNDAPAEGMARDCYEALKMAQNCVNEAIDLHN